MNSSESVNTPQTWPQDLARYRELLRSQMERISSKYQAKFDESDIVQDTLAEAHANLASFRGSTEAEMTSWLRRMLSRNVIDAVRRLRCRKRDIANEFRIHQTGLRSGHSKSVPLRAEQTSPSGRVAWNEELQRMQDAIARLPDSQREAVTLHHLQGMSLAEVAAHMKRTMPAVAGLLHRGLRTLQHRVGE